MRWMWSRPCSPHSRAALMASHGTLSLAVVLGRDRADHLGRELAALALELELFVVEPEIHV